MTMTNSWQKFLKCPPGFSRPNANLAGKESITHDALSTESAGREWQKNEKQDSTARNERPVEPVTNEVKRNAPALNGRRFKDLFKAKNANAAGQVFEDKRQDKRDDSGTEAIPMEVETIAEIAAPSCEGQRTNSLQPEEACSGDSEQDHDASGVTPVRNEDPRDELNGELTGEQDQAHSSGCQQDIEIENEQKTCTLCGHDGQILSCAGQGCGRSFHLCCVDPPFNYFPPRVWHCIWCVKKKMELGVYSVCEGIESILDVEGESDDEGITGMEKQYLVKYKGLAHVHSCWIAKKKLILKAPAVLSRYMKHKRLSRWNKMWSEPQRLFAKRLLILPKQSNSNFHENVQYCRYEWLVKWTGLGYNQATWELEDAPFFKTAEGTKLINDFETRHRVKKEANHAEKNTISNFLRRGGKLSELPRGSPENLIYVNKLLERWHKDQNALIIDAQERIIVVILFVLSLLKERSGPFLILTTSTSLPMWEAEFRRLAKVIRNVVVYEGNGDTRHMIRYLEFCNGGGCVMFQILLAPTIAVVEDLEHLQPIEWEVLVIDDFQRPTMSMHTDKIKMLAANMRLLLVSSQFKDWSPNYLHALSLLDPNYEWANDDILGDAADIDTSELKEKLVDFIVYEHKHEAAKLMEFWVPVMLTDVQTEQYCATLFSNSTLLCAYSRSDPTFSVHDILKTTRKCCDHPYLVDRSLSNFVLRGKPAPEQFDVEIQMSGKLQLLNEILPEIKRRGLRVVILFQAIDCPGKISIGDILDDFILQKFGANSYSRIDGRISRSKRQASLDVFNDKQNGNFACLLETRACRPSTKLSSVDTIIIFNSDWDPVNDLKALQKITIESQFEQLKIFRLYSSHTVEEKALMLAKEGATLDGNTMSVRRSTCQKLLTWGASCLFRRFDGSNELNASFSNPINSLEQTISDGVIQELEALLPCSSVENDSTCCSSRKNKSNYVLSVQLSEGTYQGNKLYLVGELKAQSENNLSVVRELMDKPPRFFWRNLLEGRKPRWKYMCSPLQRNKRKVKFIASLFEETEGEAKNAKKSRIEANGTFNQTPKRKLRTERGLRGGCDKKKLAGNCIRRYRRVRKVAKNVPLQRCKETAVPFQATEVHKAVTPCTVGGPNDDVVPGVQPVQISSLPNELPPSTSSLLVGHEDGNLSESREGQNDYSNVVGASSCVQTTFRTPIEGSTWPLRNAVRNSGRNFSLQPAMTPSERSEPDAADLEQENINPNFSNNHSSEASLGRLQFPQSACIASLQKEMESIQEAKEQTMKFYEEVKLQLESEREKEIREVHKKYDLLIQNSEAVMAEKKSALESCFQITYKQKLLAEAMVLKQHDLPAADSQGNKEVNISNFMKEIYQFCSGLPTGTTISEPFPSGNPPPMVESTSAAIRQCATTCNPTTPERQSVEPHTAIGSPATSVEVLNSNPPAGQQISVPVFLSNGLMPTPSSETSELQVGAQSLAVPQLGAGATKEHDQSSRSLAMSETASETERAFIVSNTPWRPPSMGDLLLSGTFHSGRRTRAPAPHLRKTVTSPVISDLTSRPC